MFFTSITLDSLVGSAASYYYKKLFSKSVFKGLMKKGAMTFLITLFLS
ncbi:phage holin family protein [Priestia filamentosa]